MTATGVFGVHRGVFEHPFLDHSDPFSMREAWLWLIGHAAWKPHRRRVGRVLIDLERGQVGATIRFLAGAWRWHRSRVERFLTAARGEGMIETHAGNGVTIITLCNYNRYQCIALPLDDDAPDSTGTMRDAGETLARHSRDRSEAEAGPVIPLNETVSRSEATGGQHDPRHSRDRSEAEARHSRDKIEERKESRKFNTPLPPEGGEAFDLDSGIDLLRSVWGRRPLRPDGANDDPDASAKRELRRLLRGREGLTNAEFLQEILEGMRVFLAGLQAEKFKPALVNFLRNRMWKGQQSTAARQMPMLGVVSNAAPATASPAAFAPSGDVRWDRARERLRGALGEAVFASWFSTAALESAGNEIVRVSVANPMLKSWLIGHYRTEIRDAFAPEIGTVSRVDIVVRAAAPLPAARVAA